MKQTFDNLSKQLTDKEKEFIALEINSNKAITEIKDNTISDLKFEKIYIYRCDKLTQIGTNAFNGTNSRIEHFEIHDTPIVNSPPNHDIFHLLSSMTNIKVIEFNNTNIQEIPPNAFKSVNGTQNKLKSISLKFSNIGKIGNDAFYDLNLETLNLEGNKIDFIPKNAFNFRENSETDIFIVLMNNKLNGSSFEVDSLMNIKRRTQLSLTANHNLTFLDERIFLPFISQNFKNETFGNIIDLDSYSVDCKDCRSSWLKKKFDFVKGSFWLSPNWMYCSDKELLNATNSFASCSE
jgi:hypothetical protein